MTTNYKISGSALEDNFLRRDLFSQGGLWMWGYGGTGQNGDNTTTNINSSPIQTVAAGANWKQISIDGYHAGAVKTDGTLWIWGLNGDGQIGDNSVANRSSPVQTVSSGNNWKFVACGQSHTAAIKTDGSLWLWGTNAQGHLGDNTIVRRSSPVQTVAGGYNWKSVSLNSFHSGAIKTDGTLWLWGYNALGGLGNNNTTDASSPIQTIAGGANWKQVSCSYFSTHAIKTNGTLWTWGYNSNGQLGDNTTTNQSSPVQTVASGTNWKLVSSNMYHVLALKTDGTLWTWGYNTYGQLGDGTTVDKSSPVQTVTGGNNWKLISCGRYNSSAIKSDGTLWTWGRGAFGQLGDGTTVDKSSPVQTVAAGTNWKYVALGQNGGSAITDIF